VGEEGRRARSRFEAILSPSSLVRIPRLYANVHQRERRRERGEEENSITEGKREINFEVYLSEYGWEFRYKRGEVSLFKF